MKQTISHHTYLVKHLAKPSEAAAYLNSVAEDSDIKSLLKALRNVVAAQGGIGELAKAVNMSRTTLYKTLSPSGNPEISTLEAILRFYGIRIGFFAIARANTSHRKSLSLPRNSNAHYRFNSTT
ncbi:MAG: transcriptional regulator [Elusimicrobiota bacterium]